MLNRYEDSPQEVADFAEQVRARYFPELARARIAVLFDLRRRKSRGNWILASIHKPNELTKHFTKSNLNPSGLDYVIVLDKAVWAEIQEQDRIRIVRHELRHTFYDLEAKGDPYKLVGHDVEDFWTEIDLNKDDPRWRIRVSEIAESVYDQD